MENFKSIRSPLLLLLRSRSVAQIEYTILTKEWTICPEIYKPTNLPPFLCSSLKKRGLNVLHLSVGLSVDQVWFAQ